METQSVCSVLRLFSVATTGFCHEFKPLWASVSVWVKQLVGLRHSGLYSTLIKWRSKEVFALWDHLQKWLSLFFFFSFLFNSPPPLFPPKWDLIISHISYDFSRTQGVLPNILFLIHFRGACGGIFFIIWERSPILEIFLVGLSLIILQNL